MPKPKISSGRWLSLFWAAVAGTALTLRWLLLSTLLESQSACTHRSACTSVGLSVCVADLAVPVGSFGTAGACLVSGPPTPITVTPHIITLEISKRTNKWTNTQVAGCKNESMSQFQCLEPNPCAFDRRVGGRLWVQDWCSGT